MRKTGLVALLDPIEPSWWNAECTCLYILHVYLTMAFHIMIIFT